MTDNHEIAYHLQSYFIVFKKTVIYSKAFRNFWASVKAEPTKDDVIRKYEVGLTQTLISAGFKPGTYTQCKTSASLITFITHSIYSLFKRSPAEIFNKIRSKKMDLFNPRKTSPTFFNWESLIVSQKLPFLKTLLLRENTLKISIDRFKNIIEKHTNYDFNMIHNHSNRIKSDETING